MAAPGRRKRAELLLATALVGVLIPPFTGCQEASAIPTWFSS